MTLELHPLCALFPRMSGEEIEARLDGVIPMSSDQINAVVASSWFGGLNKDRRAMYVSIWCNWVEVGSNQHIKKLSTKSPRYAADAAKAIIERASA